MTREETIEILEKEKTYMLNHGGDRQANALSMAIKALEQQPCEDAISKQAVLNILDDMAKDYIKENDFDKAQGVAWVKVQKLTSVSSSENPNKWIPVSESLPDDEDYVLVCYEDGHIRTAYYYIDTNLYPSEFEDCCETGWYNYNEDFMYEQDVVAWMPLPKPYKAESEDKE